MISFPYVAMDTDQLRGNLTPENVLDVMDDIIGICSEADIEFPIFYWRNYASYLSGCLYSDRIETRHVGFEGRESDTSIICQRIALITVHN
jgi:hypothetical protein